MNRPRTSKIVKRMLSNKRIGGPYPWSQQVINGISGLDIGCKVEQFAEDNELACIIHEFFEFVNKHLQTKKNFCCRFRQGASHPAQG
jgi:hypothetical protein